MQIIDQWLCDKDCSSYHTSTLPGALWLKPPLDAASLMFPFPVEEEAKSLPLPLPLAASGAVSMVWNADVVGTGSEVVDASAGGAVVAMVERKNNECLDAIMIGCQCDVTIIMEVFGGSIVYCLKTDLLAW